MKYFLSNEAVLKWIETPAVYNIKTDELYELDEESFEFLQKCASKDGSCSEKNHFIDYCLAEGLLTTEKIRGKRPVLVRSPQPSLRYLELQITGRCNLSCRHCYIGEISPIELSVQQITGICREFEDMQGLRLLITGGEPLLHSRFTEINEVISGFCFRKVLFTNGLLLGKDLLSELQVDEIQVSIDGLENSHDALRGRGSFRKALTGARLALEQGFEVSVATMVHVKNLDDFDKMENLFSSLGIRDWTVDVPCIAGRLKNRKSFQVTPETGGKYLKYGYSAGLHAGTKGFGCGYHLISVLADGTAAKCTFYSDRPLGSISEGLRTCWSRQKPVLLRNLACDCEHLELCRGGCRYRAGLQGDPLGRDLYKCRSYDILEKNEGG
jgi:radical SAM protein with 4Fe4S-binding SPASM domain